MKFHKLEITAFGPFANKECIVFSDLGENPLFLIDGPTGAGKSSILHAICYALYGETTDADRKDLGLRCDQADPDVLTELSLEFSIRDQHYRITREPTQMRKAKRGDGETEHKATAHLCKVLDDGTEETLVTKKKSEADTKIKEIIGLTADQFRQVMVLPQGKFRELLLAKSDNRQEILSTLFQTEIYKRIEQLLKDKAGDIERQHKEFEKSKTEALVDVHLENWEALIVAIDESEKQLEQQNFAKAEADKLRQQAMAKVKSAEQLLLSFNTLTKKQEEQTKHQSQSENIEAKRLSIVRAEKATAIAPQWQTLQTVQNDIEEKSTQVKQAQKAESSAKQRVDTEEKNLLLVKERYQKRDELKAKVNTLQTYKVTLAGYEAIKSASTTADVAYKKAATRKNIVTQQLNDIDLEIRSHAENQKKANELINQKAEVFKQELVAKSNLDNRANLEATKAELKKLETVVENDQQSFDKAELAYKVAEKDADRLEMIWFNSQAAVLAEKLQEGEPCQVCGSIDHPNPAEFSTDTEKVDQDMVDQARKTQGTCLNQRNDAQAKLTDSKRNVADKHLKVEELENALGENVHGSIDELMKIHDELSKHLSEIETAEVKLVELSELLKCKEKERTPPQIELKELDDKLPNLHAVQVKTQNEQETAERGLPNEYRSLETLTAAIQNTSTEIASIEKAFEEAQLSHQNAKTNLATSTTKLEGLSKDLTRLNEQLEDKQTAWLLALSNSEFLNQSDFENAIINEKDLQQLRKELRDYEDLFRDIKAAIKQMENQLKGKEKPELHVLQENMMATEAAYKAAEQDWAQKNNHKETLDRTKNKILRLNEQQSTVNRQYEVVGKLAKAASGRGEVRVSLERFVLGNLLDTVLSIASQRLHVMSKGQYRLVRQDESNQKRNTTAGLDLAIDDAHSGKSRPVATLSGGESFLASLALALALSDVVQQRSGGIQLDTLFVDEGFGSLDQESLQLAINTLTELQTSGRTIGVISHVSELKEQILQRIDVVSTRNGSTVTTIPA